MTFSKLALTVLLFRTLLFNSAIDIWWQDCNTAHRPNQQNIGKSISQDKANSACDTENEVSTTTTSLLLDEWDEWLDSLKILVYLLLSNILVSFIYCVAGIFRVGGKIFVDARICSDSW